MEMAQSTSAYTSALENEYDLSDLQRDDADDLQQ